LKEPFLPVAEPEVAPEAWANVRECLDTRWLSSAGPFVARFEKAIASYLDLPFAIATVTGTAALHLALLACGVGDGDEVVLSPLIFVACANAIRYTGAWPAFVDVDARYGQLSPEALEAFLVEDCELRGESLYNRATGRRVRALLLTHAFGHPCDLAPLVEKARRFNLRVIEDAAESLGATYRGEKTGRFGDVSCLSFNGNKVMSCGGGGMLVTRDAEIARRALHLSTNAKIEGDEMAFDEVGYNYRLPSLQAALGCAQITKLDELVATKREAFTRYERLLSALPHARLVGEADWAKSNHWMITLRLYESAPLSPRELRAALKSRGIGTGALWSPLDRGPAHQGAFTRGCEEAFAFYRRGVWLPSSVRLTPTQQERVASALTELLQ
jgi:perosamine synthetase